MPALIDDLEDSLQLRERNGRLVATQKMHVANLTPGNIFQMLADAMDFEGVPSLGDIIVISYNGLDRTLAFSEKSGEPFAPNDAIVSITWDELAVSAAGVAPTITESGVQLEQVESIYDAANLLLPLASRTPLKVTYNGNQQAIKYPRLVARPNLVIRKQMTDNPDELNDTYCLKRNSVTWKGNAPFTLLCMGIVGINSGEGLWNATASFAKDKTGKFQGIGRWTDPTTGLTPSDATFGNGLLEITEYDGIDFTGLPF